MISNLQAPDLPVVNSLSHLCCYTYTKCSTIESKLLPLLSVSVPFLKTNSYEKNLKTEHCYSKNPENLLYFSTHAKRQCLFQIKKHFFQNNDLKILPRKSMTQFTNHSFMKIVSLFSMVIINSIFASNLAFNKNAVSMVCQESASKSTLFLINENNKLIYRNLNKSLELPETI